MLEPEELFERLPNDRSQPRNADDGSRQAIRFEPVAQSSLTRSTELGEVALREAVVAPPPFDGSPEARQLIG